MWQPPPAFDWTRRRKSGLPDRAHGTRHLVSAAVDVDSVGRYPGAAEREAVQDEAVPSRRPRITWSTPTGHTYVSSPPPVLGHGSVPVPDTVEKATRRLEQALDRMASLGAPDDGGPSFDEIRHANTEPADLWRGPPASADFDVPDILPPDDYIDSQAWLEELERQAESELTPRS